MEKRFNNVFELLAEAERNYAGLVEHELLQNWYLIDPKLYKLGDLKKLFFESRLRLVPKTKKKVEGWVAVIPAPHTYLAVMPYATNGTIYRSKADAEYHCNASMFVSKITFEVEE